MEPMAAKKKPKRGEGKPEGSQRMSKGAKRKPKGAKGEPKGAKDKPKDDQNASKNRCLEKRPKRARPTRRKLRFVDKLYELETFKSVVFMWFSCFLVIFEKVEKSLKKAPPPGKIGDPF